MNTKPSSSLLSVTQNVTFIHYRFQVFLPKAVPVGLKDKRIDKIISYAKRVEGEKFEMANSLVRKSVNL